MRHCTFSSNYCTWNAQSGYMELVYEYCRSVSQGQTNFIPILLLMLNWCTTIHYIIISLQNDGRKFNPSYSTNSYKEYCAAFHPISNLISRGYIGHVRIILLDIVQKKFRFYFTKTKQIFIVINWTRYHKYDLMQTYSSKPANYVMVIHAILLSMSYINI